jgi:hypothetical protein
MFYLAEPLLDMAKFMAALYVIGIWLAVIIKYVIFCCIGSSVSAIFL